jgi:hypothetical protein
MFLFKNDPSAPTGAKAIILRLAFAALAFWVIIAFLVPMIVVEPVHTIVLVVVVLFAIFFLVDSFL